MFAVNSLSLEKKWQKFDRFQPFIAQKRYDYGDVLEPTVQAVMKINVNKLNKN